MAVNKSRPINRNPLTIQLPIGALVSITHRLSGVIIFLLLPGLLYALQLSLVSPEGLNQIRDCLDGIVAKIVIWIFLAGLSFHLVAGLRHLLMDVHIGGALQTARTSAWLTIGLTVILIIISACWVWG